MKQLLITLLAFVPCIASAQVQPWSLGWIPSSTSSYPLMGNLENAAIIPTKTPNLTAIGTVPISGQSATVGSNDKALYIGDYWDGSPANMGVDGLSFTGWVYFTATNNTTTIVAKYNDSTCSAHERQILFTVETNGKLQFLWWDEINSNTYRIYETSGTVPLNQWVHVAFDYNTAGSVQMWINGSSQTETLVGSSGTGGPPDNGAALLSFGQYVTPGGSICGSATGETYKIRLCTFSTGNGNLTDATVRGSYEQNRMLP